MARSLERPERFPAKQLSRRGLEVEVSLDSPLLASSGKEPRGCLSPGQVRECHLHGHSPALSFHLLYLFDVGWASQAKPTACSLVDMFFIPADLYSQLR